MMMSYSMKRKSKQLRDRPSPCFSLLRRLTLTLFPVLSLLGSFLLLHRIVSTVEDTSTLQMPPAAKATTTTKESSSTSPRISRPNQTQGAKSQQNKEQRALVKGRSHQPRSMDILSIKNNSITPPPPTTTRMVRPQATTGTIIQVPTPIFVLSLPKSGTTTTQRYFNCFKRGTASHHWSKLLLDDNTNDNNNTNNSNATRNGTLLVRHGECFHANVQKQRPMLENCGIPFKAYTDMGAIYYGQQQQRSNEQQYCFFPAMHGGLENIAQHYPNATIMLVIRQAQAWYNSAKAWNKGQFLSRLSTFCPGFPNYGNNNNNNKAQEDESHNKNNNKAAIWMRFYENYTHRIRAFATQHPSLTYIEVSLESMETPFVLEQQVGINAECWGDCKPIPPAGGGADRKRRCRFALLGEPAWDNTLNGVLEV